MKIRSIISMMAAAMLMLASGTVAMAAGEAFVPGEVIVKFKTGVTAAQQSSLHAQLGTSVLRHFRLANADHLKLPGGMSVQQAIQRLQASPLIEYAEPNYLVQADVIPNDPNFASLWGLNNTGQTGGTVDADIDAPEAWNITTGSPNTVIAVIDTGVDYNHPDLVGNIWTNPGEIAGNGIDDDGNGYVDDVHGYDFVNLDGDPMDDNSHGTHVSGTIAGRGNNGVGVAGVNWQAKIMGLKFLNAAGSGSTANAVLAVDYAAAMGVRVSNNSWGGGGFSQTLYNAIAASNSVFVAAAGNNAQNSDIYPHYPSSYDLPNIISVAATNHFDTLAAWFSNYGAVSVDLAAPGENILSSIPGGGYSSFNGTSMATPHVTGVVGLLLSQNPARTDADIIATILGSVDPKGLPVATGGRLNAFNALNYVPGSVIISPASGMLLTTQKVDVALIAEGGVATLLSATFDGANITGFLSGCLVPGTLVPPSPAGSTLTCPLVSGKTMGAGAHTFTVTVDVNGVSRSDTVTWNVLNATQP